MQCGRYILLVTVISLYHVPLNGQSLLGLHQNEKSLCDLDPSLFT